MHNWKAECRHGYRGPSFWGCAVADPDDVRAIGSDRLVHLAEVMYPWHQLVCRSSEGLGLLDAVTAFVQETARPSVPRRSQLIRRPAPPEIRRLVEAKRNRDPEATYIDQDEEYFKDEAQDRAGIADHEDATAGVVVFDDRRQG